MDGWMGLAGLVLAARWLLWRGCIFRCVLYLSFGPWLRHGGLMLTVTTSSRFSPYAKSLPRVAGESALRRAVVSLLFTHVLIDLPRSDRNPHVTRGRGKQVWRSPIGCQDLILHLALRRFAIPSIVAPSERFFFFFLFFPLSIPPLIFTKDLSLRSGFTGSALMSGRASFYFPHHWRGVSDTEEKGGYKRSQGRLARRIGVWSDMLPRGSFCLFLGRAPHPRRGQNLARVLGR
jgi:hypothetical protein